MLPTGVLVIERGWLSANMVVIRGDGPTAVVDTGYATHAEQTLRLVESALQGSPLDQIVNTHLHSDHCGGNAVLQEQHGQARTFIPCGQAAAVSAWDEVALTYSPTGQLCPRFRFDGLLEPGTQRALGGLAWQVHAAPGHDPHSIILFEPGSRTLVSADALWQNGFGVVFQELEGARAFDEVAATLDLIETLEPAIVIPGHGSVFTDVAGALQRARSRLHAYTRDPVRHAAHAAKVLLKFKLLEVQCSRADELLTWAASTPYFGVVHRRWFPQEPFQAWLVALMDDLVKNGAATRQAEFIANA